VVDWTYAAFAVLTLLLLASTPPPAVGDRSWGITVFLCIVGAVLGTAVVTLDYGTLNMSGAVNCTALIALAPAQAAAVAFVGGGYHAWQRRKRGIIPSNFGQSLWTASGSLAHSISIQLGTGSTAAIGVGLGVGFLVNVVATTVVITLATRDAPTQILRRTVSPSFVAVYFYFALVGILSASLIVGGAGGLLQVLGLFTLGIPVADSIAGRRIRSFLERQLLATDQQVQYGELARGTMHNVRNGVSVALSNLDEIGPPTSSQQASALAAVRLGLEETHSALIEAVGASSRASVSFSRIELGELAKQTGRLLRRHAQASGVTVTVTSHDSPIFVFGHPGLLRELLTNLILNAVDACRRGGTVNISYALSGKLVQLIVVDDGPGVPDSILTRLFEPGFSTKGSGGTGLGLYTALGIARQHAGDLQFAGSSGRRTAFVLTLPEHAQGVVLLRSRLEPY
jgi:signal transduction histidine kinase